MKIIINIFLVLFFSSFIFANLVRPINGEKINYVHVVFEWQQEPNAIGYNIQVSDQQQFNNLILDIEEESTVYIDNQNFDWDNTYFWRVRSILNCTISDCEYGPWISTADFSIGDKEFSNLEVDFNNEDQFLDGYIAIGAFQPELESVIIDKYGNEIWNDAGFNMQLNYVNEYGNLYGFSITDYPLNTGMKTNMDMDVVWSTMDPINPVDTHIIKQLPNGNFMGFIRVEELGPIPSDNYMTEYFRLIGYQADGETLELPWYGQMIIEWNQNHEIVWSWNPFDYFSMLDYDNYEGTWYNAYFNQEHDWMHSNAYHFDPIESVIYVSHRHLSRITKISYPSGDVIWNMGLPSEYMASGDEHICTDLLFSFQHNIQLMDNGDLLFFDNGNLSDILLGDSNPTTRIRRIKVINDSYCETVWQYDLPQELHGLGMGSVQELENGNYSIYTYGSGLGDPECSVIEVNIDKEIIWKATGNNNAAWYRAYKIPSLHPDAFSVIAQDYTNSDSGEEIIFANSSIDFTIINKSGYDLPYHYFLSDQIDGGVQLFTYEEGIVNIEPYGTANISFFPNSESSYNSTEILFSIWPKQHEYAIKEINLTVELDDIIYGDLNGDGLVNILDVVNLVNIILGISAENTAADLNEDGLYNVLDVVLIINLILEI